ncbi:hypothetical protein BDW22DRAFT_1301731, partial [Trametopsis cervina]
MSVTEFATLIVQAPHNIHSPVTKQFFEKVATAQSGASGYPVHYFQDVGDPAILYIVTGWNDVAAHHAWISGHTNQSLLAEMGSMVEVKELVHLKIN